MAIKYVAPLYHKAEKRDLYTKAHGRRQRLNIVALPVAPGIGAMPREVAVAFGSIIEFVTDLKLEDPALVSLLKDLETTRDLEGVQAVVTAGIAPKVRHLHPKLKGEEHTAYICPVISDGEAGYLTGYVVAWDESDARTIAEYLAGGRADIYLDLRGPSDDLVDSDLLGSLSYSDVTGKTGAYWQILEGEKLGKAIAGHLGIRTSETKDMEFLGEEFLPSFENLT